ncbi:MAG: EAL domain-containing response regulator [Rhodospirillaceae bacterium]|nr:EAL domain-containing response regulator [Rhodospirillaceae bacterium]MBT4426690.1 EAL domain-containing response regulator [Rhodospirillaceae bacterium]MBT7292577.1 EAL domain-containing response regulator [Rhodospirillaceae bacterium]
MTTELNDFSVLIADDDAIAQRLMESVLGSIGIGSVALAEDGAVALACHDSMPGGVDFVLLDIDMPGMDGLEFLRHLSHRPVRPAIILIGSGDKAVLFGAREMALAHKFRVVGEISKPIEPVGLKTLLANIFAAYSPHTERRGTARGALGEAELRDGIAAGALQPYYQPQIRLDDGGVRGVEALARWRRADGGLIFPDQFIALAEKTGLIDPLTDAILDGALKQESLWRAEGLAIQLSINLSIPSLTRFDLPDRVMELAATYGLEPGGITLEITESWLIWDVAAALETLTRFRLKGFGLSIDDYGSGFSSMRRLKTIPFTELKLDRAFVNGAHRDAQVRAMLESSVDLAKKLELLLVAEGVEEEEDWKLLRDLGVDLAQGNYFTKPLPGAEVLPWAAKRRRGVAVSG